MTVWTRALHWRGCARVTHYHAEPLVYLPATEALSRLIIAVQMELYEGLRIFQIVSVAFH